MPDQRKPTATPQRILGGYLLALCVYQIGIYFWPSGPPFILDPRAGIAVLMINRFSFDNKVIHPIEWVTAAWLVLIAAMIFYRGAFLKTYLTAEIILAAPTVYYIAILATHHGGDFAPGFPDLVLTALLFTVFSLVPLALAIQCIVTGSRRH